MTDHRADDLSYGHLGEATYDTDRKEWDFSREINNEYHLQRVTPFKEYIPASLQDVLYVKKRPSHIAQYHQKWLKRAHPEMFPANSVSSTIDENPIAMQDELPSTAGALLAVGRVRYTKHMSNTERVTQIFAMPCGKAGEVLKLIRPRVERHSWEKGSGVKLSLMDASSAEPAHWVNTGGTIRQIVFADDEHGVGTWLAVRQAAVTTIFRPAYRNLALPAIVPRGYPKIYPSSRLTSNPVASLKVEQSDSHGHVDVTFNPWYVRQFAVINQRGCWAIWDLEGRQQKSSSALELVAGKHGKIYESSTSEEAVKAAEIADGWHRIIWAGGVSTVIVCSRTQLAVFDVKANPSLLPSPVLVAPNSLEWILDVKRSPTNWSHLFVLTTCRIFWMEIVPAGEEKDAQDNGARIIFSHRHFRDANDETAKLCVIIDEEEPVVLVNSSTSPLVHFYRFFRRSDGSNQPVSFQGSIVLPHAEVDLNNLEKSFRSICVTSALVSSKGSGNLRGEGMHYLERNIRFYQVWLLRSDLALGASLHAMMTDGKKFNDYINAPTFKTAQPLQSVSSRNVTGDSFIVPDGFQEDLPEAGKSTDASLSVNRVEISNDLALRINSRSIFQAAFAEEIPTNSGGSDVKEPTKNQTMSEILNGIKDVIQEGRREGHLPMATLHEMASFRTLTSDLDQTELALQEFAKSLNLEGREEASSLVIFSNLISAAGVRFSDTEDARTIAPSLLQIYDNLVRVWVTSLPLTTHGKTRLKKFQIIRKMALELCLSSASISLKTNSATSTQITNTRKEGYEEARSGGHDNNQWAARSSSPILMSSQVSQATARTPSLYSEATTSSSAESSEDPAILRLRQYAVSIKSRPDLSSGPAWLTDWPETPGIDPATFSWETAQRKSLADEINSDDEDAILTKKEEARRKRRTEKFLRRERAKASQIASSQPGSSQPGIAVFGSQPDIPHPPAFSSQVVEDIPMTQPNRGTFGSRPKQNSIKKPKKRRAAGF